MYDIMNEMHLQEWSTGTNSERKKLGRNYKINVFILSRKM